MLEFLFWFILSTLVGAFFTLLLRKAEDDPPDKR